MLKKRTISSGLSPGALGDPFGVHHFEASLFTTAGKGGWTFAPVPPDKAPPVMGAWGMTPVLATVNGKAWKTTVWRDKTQRTLLPIPKKVRGKLTNGDVVQISLQADRERAVGPAHPME